MKLKQALIIGLSSAVLAIPAIAAESATDLNSLPAANANQPAAVVTPAKKEAIHHRKGHKKVSMEKKVDPKQEKGNAKLDELNTLNSDSSTTDPEKDQTEKDSIAS
ncbi:MAG: hypothetical protein E6K54_05245 [Gammaproteobacteria bacterium]|nr:MAG: hypothetical protein E6K54_05245 [Gammaproteobacteria bacterium]